MNHILFEQIDNSGFIRNGELNHPRIQHASPVDIIDFSKQSIKLTSAEDIPREQSIFSHSASLSLGAGRWPCAALDCRLTRAKELAQFAAFYSDKVYIRNFLADHVDHVDKKNLPDETALRKDFADDLLILNYLRPLIEAGKIIPITPPNYCMHCLAKLSLGQKDDKRLKRALKKLVDQINKEIVVSIEVIESSYHLCACGPERLLEHGSSLLVQKKTPPNLDQMPRIMAQLKSGKEVTLSRSALRKIRYDEHLAGKNFDSIIFELATSQCLNTSFLTERPLHLELLRDISADPAIEQRNQIIQKNLTCLVPFLEGIEPSEIVRLRAREEEAFIVFRSTLNRAIDEYKACGKDFSERDAQALYQDIIRPELASLDAKVKSAKRSLIKGTSRKVIAWTGAISFGLYTGFLPAGLAAVAGALGFTKILAEFTEGLMAKADVEESVRSQDMYFLWKVRKRQKS